MAVLTDSSTVWECATRKTRGSAGVDAVAMLALISHPSSKSSSKHAMRHGELTILYLQNLYRQSSFCSSGGRPSSEITHGGFGLMDLSLSDRP